METIQVKFGQKGHVLTIHKIVEDEVHRSARLKSLYPWVDVEEFASKRLARQIRLTAEDKASIQAVQSVLHGWVLADPDNYTSGGRSPPGSTDCLLLALGQVKPAIVVTDDLGMHALAKDFGLTVWHGFELSDKLRSAKVLDSLKVREIYDALEANGDLPKCLAIGEAHGFLEDFRIASITISDEAHCANRFFAFFLGIFIRSFSESMKKLLIHDGAFLQPF